MAVIGLILYVIISGGREQPGQTDASVASQIDPERSGEIRREALVPPGMRARQYVSQLRNAGKPYPGGEIFARAQRYLDEGSLADAHLLYFFAARQNHLPAIMKLAEMSDPLHFRIEDSLLDRADGIQAYKWYSKAAELGHETAAERIQGLQQWAVAEAESGNRNARQLLLNFR